MDFLNEHMYVYVWECVFSHVAQALVPLYMPKEGMRYPSISLSGLFTKSRTGLPASNPHDTNLQACTWHLTAGIWTQALMLMQQVFLPSTLSLLPAPLNCSKTHMPRPLFVFGEHHLNIRHYTGITIIHFHSFPSQTLTLYPTGNMLNRIHPSIPRWDPNPGTSEHLYIWRLYP